MSSYFGHAAWNMDREEIAYDRGERGLLASIIPSAEHELKPILLLRRSTI